MPNPVLPLSLEVSLAHFNPDIVTPQYNLRIVTPKLQPSHCHCHTTVQPSHCHTNNLTLTLFFPIGLQTQTGSIYNGVLYPVVTAFTFLLMLPRQSAYDNLFLTNLKCREAFNTASMHYLIFIAIYIHKSDFCLMRICICPLTLSIGSQLSLGVSI